MAETKTTQGEGEAAVRSPAHAVAIHAPPPKSESPPPRGSSESSSRPSRFERMLGQAEAVVRPQSIVDIAYPHLVPVRSSCNADDDDDTIHQRVSAITIQMIPEPLSRILDPSFANPIAVSIGPYHHGLFGLQWMEEAKKVARDEFCRAAGQPHEVIVRETITPLAADARGCYDASNLQYMADDRFVDIMFMDGCFLLQFMACMCPANREDAPAPDGLWAKVHARVNVIAKDVMLLENQLPWRVVQALMDCTPGVSWPVVRFLDLMASAFDVGNDATAQQPATDLLQPPPPHLLGLFHRRQMGAARTDSHRVPSLSSMSSTAVELAEMGVKLTASKSRVFGDMTMTKRRRRLGVFGELALAPVVLSNLTACWLFNMVAYEACLGAAFADNFAVSSYVSVVAMLTNRQDDVQELRRKGVVVSALSDEGTLGFLKALAPHVRVGYRYYDVFQRLQEYRRERWLWIVVHRFLYRHLKTIVTVVSTVGVLAGLFKIILSVKQPQQGE